METLASLGLRIDSRPVVQSTDALYRFTLSCGKAQSAADALSTSATRMGTGFQAISRAASEAERSALGLAGAMSGTRSATEAAAASLGRARASMSAAHAAAENAARSHNGAASALLAAERAANQNARAVGLTANQWRNLALQGIDAVAMLASGSSIFQVLATQSAQVVDVLGASPGGVAGGLRGIAAAVPMSVAGIAAIVAALGAAGLAYNAFDTQQRAIQRGLIGSGRASALSAGDIRTIAMRSPLADSLSESLVTDFARTGNADTASATTALSLVRDLAASTNTDFATAGRSLTAVFADVSKGAGDLDERFKFLSAPLKALIANLQNTGHEAEAVKITLDALAPKVGRYDDLRSFGDRMSDRASTNWNDTITGFQRGVAALAGDRRVESSGDLARTRAALTAEANTLTAQLAQADEKRKKLFSAVPMADIERTIPVDVIKARLQEIAQAQDELGRRTVAAQEASTAAVQRAASAQATTQLNRIDRVAIGLERQNTVARLNPVEQQIVQAQRDAGTYQEPDMATRLLEAYRKNPERFGPPSARYGDSISRPDDTVGPNPAWPEGHRTNPNRVAETFKVDADYRAARISKLVEDGSAIEQRKQLTETTRVSTITQEAEAAAIGKTVGQSEALKASASLRTALGQQGIRIDEEVTRKINEQADAYGRNAQRIAEQRQASELQFQRSQLDRTPTEAAIAAQLRPIYGDDLERDGARTSGAYVRTTMAIQDTQRAMSSLASMGNTLIDPLVDSTRSWGDAFADLSRQIARALLQATLFGQGPFASVLGMQGAGQGPGGLFGMALGNSASNGSTIGNYVSGNFFPEFAAGGYTGPGGRYDPAGIVHRGEVVFSQADVARFGGVGAVEAMRLGFPGYDKGGIVEGPPAPLAMAPPANANGATVHAPITITMQGSSGDPALDRKAADMVGRSVEQRMRQVFHEEQANALRTNGALWRAGVRQVA